MLKGRAWSWKTLYLATLVVFLGGLCVHSALADIVPVGGAGNLVTGPLGSTSLHRYIGHTLPPLPTTVGTRQGSGPDPDSDLTLNAYATVERDPHGAPSRVINRLVFSSNGAPATEDAEGPIGSTLPDDANYNLWVMRPDGSEQVRVTKQVGDEIQPVYSPGGNLLLYAGNQTGTWEIYLIELRNPTVVRCLTKQQPGNKLHPTWSADGNWIAYQCDAAGNWDIYKLRADGAGNQEQLTTAATDDTDPAWVPAANTLSPDAKAIAYTATVGANTRVYWVHADTKATEELTSGSGGNDKEPAWTWNGAQFAFASDRLTDGDTVPDFNIFRVGARGEAGGLVPELVSNLDPTNTADDTNPSWQVNPQTGDIEDPQRIYYESVRSHTAGGGPSTSPDIWATLYSDIDPPTLVGLPWVGDYDRDTGNHDRFASPGDDIRLHVQVYDKDSGVTEDGGGQVRMYLRNADATRQFIMQGRGFETSFDGQTGFELPYPLVNTAGIRLYDDGDAANGDEVANDGIYSAAYPVPTSLAGDLVIDVSVTDNSGNTQVYDSVYGFTSRVFSPRSPVLFVNDYCEGQRFIFDLGYSNNNDSFAGVFTESFYLSNPGIPEEGPLPDFNSITTYAANLGRDEGPDIWRIISRGPVPTSVYQHYLPSVEYQLDPQEAVDNPITALPTREVRVAPRAVIWAAPHTGDVWVADGSIVDAGTQADLASFIDQGGRIMFSGQNIAWALSMNGSIANNFLSTYLRAGFVRDDYGADVVSLVGPGADPVAYATFGGHENYCHAEAYPTTITIGRSDASLSSYYPDVITAGAGATVLYGYGAADGPVAAVRYEDTTTTAKVIYLAFGFESVHRGYHDVNGWHPLNHRSHLIHNALCWMRTGAFRGQVVAIDDGKPITNPNPVVLIWAGGHTLGDRTDLPDYAVRCQDDGRYRIAGIPAGRYTIEVTRREYEIDHIDGNLTHGGWEPYIRNFAITRARPGAVTGVVTSEATDEPLALVNVSAWPVPDDTEDTSVEPDWTALGATKYTTQTAADGSYKLADLPVGEYYLRADGTAITYGTDWSVVTITSGNTTTEDMVLPAADGTLAATVQTTVGGTTTPIQNALVAIKSASGATVASGTTDATGKVSIAVQPGTYTAIASAAGYDTSAGTAVAITSNTTATVVIKLSEQPPGAISGRVLSASSGTPVGGVTVQLLSNDTVIDTATTAATLTPATTGEASYNFRFASVPTGTLTVRPLPVGFTATPTERSVTVTSGKVTDNVAFGLTSLHTFPAGLQIISTPYDYTTTGDPATILGVASGLKLATWEASAQRYRVYPQAPADRLRPGVGYWLRLSSAADVTLQGTVVASPATIALSQGWNLIGDPITSPVDLYVSHVTDGNGTYYTMPQALSAGLIESTLFAFVLNGYQSTTMLSPWVGAWIKAADELPGNGTLTLTVNAATSAVGAETVAIKPPSGGWVTPIVTSVSGMVDSSTYFGAAPQATAGADRNLDLSKPPMPQLGPSVYSCFVNDETPYAVDVRSSLDPHATWDLSVDTTAAGADVTLRWPDLQSLPKDVRPILTDQTTGRTVYMRTTSAYTFKAAGEARHFTVSLDPAGAGLVVSAVSAQQAGGGVRVAYALSTAATVDVQVLNMAGRPVATVCSARTQAAGANALLWSARSDAGAMVPAGRYLVRVTARSESGQQAQVVAPLQVRR